MVSDPPHSLNGYQLGKTVLVHDYLNQRGGAERVVLEMSNIWPDAAIYTSLYRPSSTFAEFAHRDVRTTSLDRLPVDRHFRSLFPLYPAAFRSLGAIDADVVVSSSSGWSHAVRTSERAYHVVYCHSPSKWLWGDYLGSRRGQLLPKPVASFLRRWDIKAASRPNLYIANSREIQRQIERAYGRMAEVVYPPVDVERFTPRPRGERLLTVARLLGYKRLELIVDAATKAGIRLDVVGIGPELANLRARAGSGVTFHGSLDDVAVTELFEHCRAYCMPAREDFGISAVEAQAAGKPVIAFGSGGALETVEEGVSGVFFTHHSVDSVLDAIARSDKIDTPPEQIAALASRFSPATFRLRLTEVISAGLADRAISAAY